MFAYGSHALAVAETAQGCLNCGRCWFNVGGHTDTECPWCDSPNVVTHQERPGS